MMYCHMYISQCQSFASHSAAIRALYECLVIVLLSTYSLNISASPFCFLLRCAFPFDGGGESYDVTFR